MGLIRILKGEEPTPLEALKNFENPGQWGEYLTEYMLNEKHIQGRFKVFTNTYVPYKNKTSEIDVLMVHEKGIFVFESKNYSGWIFGDREQKQWTQTLKNGKKSRFYNPLMQNTTHINALSDYLALPKDHFSSYIVFSERCTLKDVPSSSDEHTILQRHRLLKDLKHTLNERTTIYDSSSFEMICKMLDFIVQDENTATQHVERVKGYTDGMICPYCGGELVERKGKRGTFVGCSSFPKCRFTKDK